MSAWQGSALSILLIVLCLSPAPGQGYMLMVDDHQEYMKWALMGASKDLTSADGAAFFAGNFGADTQTITASDGGPAVKLFNGICGGVAALGCTRATAPGQIEISRMRVWQAAAGDLVVQEVIEATIAHETAHWVDLSTNGMFTDGIGGNPPEWGNALENTLYGFVKVVSNAPGNPKAPHGRAIGALNAIEAGAHASFNTSTGAITFADNVNLANRPEIDMVSYIDGGMFFTDESTDPIAHALITMSPIALLPDRGDGLFHFTNMNLRVGAGQDFLTATVHDIIADPQVMRFTGLLTDVHLNLGLGSQFIQELSLLEESIWTGPAPLLSHTDNFSVDGTAQFATAISGLPVPEPATLVLCLIGAAALAGRGNRKE